VTENRSARCLDRFQSLFDISGIKKAETKVDDAASAAGSRWVSLKHQHVMRAGRLCLNESWLLIDRYHSEHLPIKPQRSLRVTHRERNVSQATRPDRSGAYSHRPNELHVNINLQKPIFLVPKLELGNEEFCSRRFDGCERNGDD
jgi:hypothetical protein